ncbi:MAG: phage holin family protein [Methylomonas sp.]|jgi:uncharacterized membrane protein SpoIIM required for sporulation
MQKPAAANDNSQVDADPLRDAHTLWYDLRQLGRDHFRLAALETQRAGVSLIAMIVAGIMLAFLLNAVWFGLMAALVMALIENGVIASSAILLAVAFSLLLALVLIRLIRGKSRYLLYPAIQRSLQAMPPAPRETEQS